MKRFWLVMLSLGLVLAFSASAMAVDVKFSGSFYAAGMYLDKTNLRSTGATNESNPSTAFYYQRLRVQTDFIVSPGLKLVTRFDAMERIWGGVRGTDLSSVADGHAQDSAGTRVENQNIAFDWAYVEWLSPVGMVQVGYMDDGAFGTVFFDNSIPMAKIQFITKVGPVTAAAYIGKVDDNSQSAVGGAPKTDMDMDKYVALAVYDINKDISLGLLYAFERAAQVKPYGLLVTGHVLNPFFKAKFGPVALEGELAYAFGKMAEEDAFVSTEDISISNLAAYLNATADFGIAYLGGTFAYVSGDDPATTDKLEGGLISGGIDFNPTLIMFNQDLAYWQGGMTGYNGTIMNFTTPAAALMANGMSNAWFVQGKVGVRPIAKLDINAALAWAKADQYKDTAQIGKNYGWELDVTGTYKITNNLSYMLGFGYLWTGDYFKGSSTNVDLRNNYLLTNKLTLTF